MEDIAQTVRLVSRIEALHNQMKTEECEHKRTPVDKFAARWWSAMAKSAHAMEALSECSAYVTAVASRVRRPRTTQIIVPRPVRVVMVFTRKASEPVSRPSTVTQPWDSVSSSINCAMCVVDVCDGQADKQQQDKLL